MFEYNNIFLDILFSWKTNDSFETNESILKWIDSKNKNLQVSIQKSSLANSDWRINSNGYIERNNGGFFSIVGYVSESSDCVIEQPAIIQDEIGYLGIICKKINGVLHFLMQAKIEPGNVNKIQISPTIQATKSNFTTVHGGKKPAYLDYFLNVDNNHIIVDQIQSEQSSRFIGKRNRNIIIYVEDDVEILDSHKWMTLKQIKDLMLIDNLVNMDTRTVISCIPFCLSNLSYEMVENYFFDKSLALSIFDKYNEKELIKILHYINNYKMFSNKNNRIVSIYDLNNWHFHNDEFVCKSPFYFKVIFCNIAIEGREVRKWTQPLFEANGIATFGLMVKVVNGKKMFLIKAKPEIGCFDKIELGPSIQEEFGSNNKDSVVSFFYKKLGEKKADVDVMLSEEGGRFYCEQNRNIILTINDDELDDLPDGYFWASYKTLNLLLLNNNNLNIQLRNLLSLLRN